MNGVAEGDMAIYHLHCGHGSRQGGASALAKLRYVLRDGKYARGRDDLVASGCGHLPDWCAGDPAALFAAADRYERANGRLYVELEGALPVELDDQQREELARAMMRETSATGLPFVYGIHAGRRRAAGEPANPHFHGLLSERINDGVGRDPAQWFRRANPGDPAAGGAAKDRSLKGHEWVADTRSLYERLVNEALERAGCPERVTAESHRTRIARAEAVGDHETAEELLLHPPGIHMGPAACAIERGGPARPGRQTERGNLARARADEAAGLREDLESVERELKEYRQAAVAAARDAGVDETLVVAAQSGDPNKVLALDNATDQRREEIGDAAVAVGFSRDAMECLRREAEPESHELGWWAVVAATEERQRKADAETAAQNAGLDPEAVYRAAEKQGGDAVDFLKRETANRTAEIVAAAREVHLDNQAIERIMREAKLREPGVAGWGAVVEETVARRQRLNLAELAARSLQLNTKAVRETMPTQEGDPLDVLEQEIAKRLDKIRAAPDHHDGEQRERIGIIDAASQGWCTVSQQLVAERRRRKAHLESSARHLHLEVDRTYAKARHGDGNDDPLAHLEREIQKRERKLMEEARAAFLPADEICRIRYPEAELQDGGSGLAALAAATEKRRQRQAAAESSARTVGLHDIVAVYEDAKARRVDPLAHLERKAANRPAEIMEEARAVFAEEEIERIRVEAESLEVGSGWRALGAAAEERRQRQAAAESTADILRLDVHSIYASARKEGEDGVELLERAILTQEARILERAREVLADEEIERIRVDREAKAPGWGLRAVGEATDRRQRKNAAELSAGHLDLDVDRVYEHARRTREDGVELLERVISDKQIGIAAEARRVLLDDERIEHIRVTAEARAAGSGWRAVVHATKERGQLKADAELAALAVGLDIDGVYANAQERNEDQLEALLRKIDWPEYKSQLRRATAEAEALLPATRPNKRADYWVPAVSNETLDHVKAAVSEPFGKAMVDELREVYDPAERYESETRYLQNVTRHNVEIRPPTSHSSNTPARDSSHASVCEQHRSAILDAIKVVANREADGRHRRAVLALDSRVRLASYLGKDRLPYTNQVGRTPPFQPPAVSDATFDTAEQVASTRRVAETIVAIRRQILYPPEERDMSERAWSRDERVWRPGVFHRVILEVESAWQSVDAMGEEPARRELDSRDAEERIAKRRRTARRKPARNGKVPDGSGRGRWGTR